MRPPPLCCALLFTVIAACDAPSPSSRPSMTDIDALFSAFSKAGMPGASVLVIQNDTVTVRASYGLADVDSSRRVTPSTNFRLASLSKQFTATAVMLLAAEGRLSIGDAAARYLPELPRFASAVTIRHLLTHTSGLWDYEDFVPDTQTYQVRDADALTLIASHSDSLYFAPGAEWRYSNTGYALLALIVERVSGQRYGDFLKARIFDPVGMTHTVAHEEGRTTPMERAYGHRVRGDSVRRTDQSNTSAVLGDGGIYSSIDDLMRWESALVRGSLLPDSLWREATTPFVLTDGRPTQYGYGWFIDTFAGARRMRHHGETRGFTNAISRFPERRLTIVILTNRSDSAPWDLVDRIAAKLLRES